MTEPPEPDPSWICDICMRRRDEHDGQDHKFFVFQGSGTSEEIVYPDDYNRSFFRD